MGKTGTTTSQRHGSRGEGETMRSRAFSRRPLGGAAALQRWRSGRRSDEEVLPCSAGEWRRSCRKTVFSGPRQLVRTRDADQEVRKRDAAMTIPCMILPVEQQGARGLVVERYYNIPETFDIQERCAQYCGRVQSRWDRLTWHRNRLPGIFWKKKMIPYSDVNGRRVSSGPIGGRVVAAATVLLGRSRSFVRASRILSRAGIQRTRSGELAGMDKRPAAHNSPGKYETWRTQNPDLQRRTCSCLQNHEWVRSVLYSPGSGVQGVGGSVRVSSFSLRRPVARSAHSRSS